MTFEFTHPIAQGLAGISGGSIILIAFIILLLFGGKKLPGLAKSVGQSLNAFKQGKEEGLKDADDGATEAKAKEVVTSDT